MSNKKDKEPKKPFPDNSGSGIDTDSDTKRKNKDGKLKKLMKSLDCTSGTADEQTLCGTIVAILEDIPETTAIPSSCEELFDMTSTTNEENTVVTTDEDVSIFLSGTEGDSTCIEDLLGALKTSAKEAKDLIK